MESNQVAQPESRRPSPHTSTYPYTVDHRGDVTPTTTYVCCAGDQVTFSGPCNHPIYAVLGNADCTEQLFGVSEIVVRTRPYTVQPGAVGNSYCITTNVACTSCCGGDPGTVGNIKVGS